MLSSLLRTARAAVSRPLVNRVLRHQQQRFASNNVVTFEVYRFQGTGKPYLQLFDVDLKDCGPMVLDALFYIKNNLDSTLTFRRSCREGICGSCAMSISGKNSLACLRSIESSIASRGAVQIYPLPHLPVFKDLVPDLTQFYAQHASVQPWLHLTPEQEASKTESLQSIDDRKKLDGLYECVLCACCSTSCPSYWWVGDEQYLGPAALLQAFRWINDSRDQAFSQRMDFLIENHQRLFSCHSIQKCSTVCPKHLDPALAIREIKNRVAPHMGVPKTIANMFFQYH